MAKDSVRVEHDLLGERDVPSEAYWGIHTLRALENFPISGTPISHYPQLINGLCAVKQAAALANCELGILDPVIADAIVNACIEIRNGALRESFCVDAIQGGAGTSTNMNVNEVIANRGLELLGFQKGDYAHLHPLDHVNLSQSTNDAYPTALSVAVHNAIGDLLTAMVALRGALETKAEEFCSVLKMGRTQLQDAVPMTLGQEFTAFAVMLGEDIDRLGEARTHLLEVNLGGTAIGTGINTNRRYSPLAIRKTSSRPPKMSGPLYRSPVFSSALRSSCPRLRTTCASFRRDHAPVLEKLTYPLDKLDQASCRARSTL